MPDVLEVCPSCRGRFASAEGPLHPYMHSSPGCWAAFGQVLAREYSNPALSQVHRLSVDAYAVQHPGDHSRQAIQSVGLHLVRLCLLIERGLPPARANDAMLRAARHKEQFTWLERPENFGSITVADVVTATAPESHAAAVRAWANEAWRAWAPHHLTARCWADAR